MANFIVSVSPHLREKTDTASIMRDVLIALAPALIASFIIFGERVLLVVAVCVATCCLCEYLFEKITKKPCTVRDCSACVTGVLLAYNLPVGIPLWQAAFGSAVAIVVVKMLFGGIGQNFANPAITARIIMLLAFYGGCIGETSAIALLLGGAYLLIRRVITWHTPVAFIGTVFVFTLLLGEQPVYQILSGGLLLGAFFMATDYATTPSTNSGRLILGIGCGLITVLIRVWGSYPEGVSFSILLMNILTPHISKLTRTKPFGGVEA